MSGSIHGPASIAPLRSRSCPYSGLFLIVKRQYRPSVRVNALFGKKSPPSSQGKPCKKCKSKGSLTCPGCKGTGKNKKNGNVFERWKCYDCQGFGLISCPVCGGRGLTPEQRGER